MRPLRHSSPRRRRWRSGAILALGISLALHGIAIGRLVAGRGPPGRPAAARSIALAPLSAATWEGNRRVAPVPLASEVARPRILPGPVEPRAPAPTAAPEPPPQRPTGQVVDLEGAESTAPSVTSRFLAERDSRVDKETRSRHASARFDRPAPRPTSAPRQTSAPRPTTATRDDARSSEAVVPDGASSVASGAGGAPRHDAGRPRAIAARSVEEQRRAARPEVAGRPGELTTDPGRLALRMERDGDRPRAMNGGATTPSAASPSPPSPSPTSPRSGQVLSPSSPPSPAVDGGLPDLGALAVAPGASGRLQLRPTAATFDRVAGGPAPDHLEGVEEGEATYLNARGWKYAGYFDRISRAVRGQWNPNVALRDRDPTGARFGGRDRSTLLVVRLDERGSVREVAVQRSSGLDFLDAAAIQALRRAQPFENPPRGLADERGEIVFSYGFTVQASTLDRLFRRAAP